MDFQTLKTRHREIRDASPEPVRLRVHRALSWLNRAERETDDPDAAFVFLWIAFNATYGAEVTDPGSTDERSAFDEFFRKLVALDTDRRLYDALWHRYAAEIRHLLRNQFVFPPFWKHQNGVPGCADWRDRFERAERRALHALAQVDTRTVLAMVFDRLYTLRNQLVHGGATWNGGLNRDQVRDGARILGLLVPVFITLVMEHPQEDWGRPYYPVVS